MHPVVRWLPALASVVAATLLKAPLERFLQEDVCLDRGGRVLRDVGRCELAPDYVVPLASFPGATSGVQLLLGVLVAVGFGISLLLLVRHHRRHRDASA